MKSEKRWRQKLNRINHLVRDGKFWFKEKGALETIRRASEVVGFTKNITYSQWERIPLYNKRQLEIQRANSYNKNIKFSLITQLNNTEGPFLREMIDSVLSQTYSNWELCMTDVSDSKHEYVERICLEYARKDERVRYKKLEQNPGIAAALNACIDMADGEYISIVEHTDILHTAVLHDMMKEICDKDADFVYTDEAYFLSPNSSDITFIHFKPDYAPDNLIANNYIGHFISVKRSLMEKCGCFRGGVEGAQEHELLLRVTDAAECITHIPEVLYYCRVMEELANNPAGDNSHPADAGKKVVEYYLRQKGFSAQVCSTRKGLNVFRVSYDIPYPHPLVSIIIPNYEHLDDLKKCIESIKEKTSYENYEIIVVENNSKDLAIFEYYDAISKEDNIRVINWPGTGFNWSAINNYAVKDFAEGEYILLMNNDMEVISSDWIQEMMMYSQRQDVGLTGAMLYYPDNTIQHAGVITGFGDLVGHAFSYCRRGESGYANRLLYAQDMSAVTGACMLMRRTVFEKIGGINEDFPVEYNDIDLCFRLRDAGYLIVWTPYAELYHYESKSRGDQNNAEKRKKTQAEIQKFRSKWESMLKGGDPYYNPNLSNRIRTFGLNREKYKRRKRENRKSGSRLDI